MKYYAVVPAYEPNQKMLDLLKELQKNKYEIIVINDGSGKDYDTIFNEAEKYAIVLKHSVNMGKGRALKTAFKYIKENSQKYIIVTIDADYQHLVSDANKLREYIKNNPHELALGKRPRNKNVPIRSIFGNTITKFIFALVSKQYIYDTQSGLRAFSNELIDYMLSSFGEHYEYEMNVLLYAKESKIKIKEIEISTIYFDNNRASHFKTIRDSYQIYKQIFKYSKNSLAQVFVMYISLLLLMIFINNFLLANVLSLIVALTSYYFLNKKSIKVKPFIINVILFIIFETIIIYLLESILSGKFFSIKIYIRVIHTNYI